MFLGTHDKLMSYPDFCRGCKKKHLAIHWHPQSSKPGFCFGEASHSSRSLFFLHHEDDSLGAWNQVSLLWTQGPSLPYCARQAASYSKAGSVSHLVVSPEPSTGQASNRDVSFHFQQRVKSEHPWHSQVTLLPYSTDAAIVLYLLLLYDHT